ncbi:MAG: hypothetical protein EP330_04220 [Deltaproteobacteria bacterium]|nr:MAG: hypothetical protein EP330_04220 [Deltaproteobacteria bacterium]
MMWLLWLLACGPTGPSEEHQAEQALRSFLIAALAGDCEAVMKAQPGLDTLAKCHEYVEATQERGLAIVEVTRVTPNGRKPDQLMVYTLVNDRGEQRELIWGLTHTADGWIVAQ